MGISLGQTFSQTVTPQQKDDLLPIAPYNHDLLLVVGYIRASIKQINLAHELSEICMIYYFDSLSFSILIVGDYKVGKSNLAKQFVTGSNSPLSIGLLQGIGQKDIEITLSKYNNSKYSIKLILFVSPESECSVRPNIKLTPMLYKNKHGIIWVFDTNNKESFNHIKNKWFNQYQQYISNDKTNLIPILVSNDYDINSNNNIGISSNDEQVISFSKQNNIPYIEIQNRDNPNEIKKIFQMITKQIIQNSKWLNQWLGIPYF